MARKPPPSLSRSSSTTSTSWRSVRTLTPYRRLSTRAPSRSRRSSNSAAPNEQPWPSATGSQSCELPCHIVAYDDRCNLSSHASFPLEVVQLKPAGSAWAKIGALRRYFEDRPPSAPQPLLSGYQPALHATLSGLRGFHTLMHDTPSLFDQPGKQPMRRRLSNQIVGFGLRSGGSTIVTSEFLRDECRRDFRVKAEIARMGGLAGTFAPQKTGSTLRLLSVCRIEPNKRLDWPVEVLAESIEHPSPLSASLFRNSSLAL